MIRYYIAEKVGDGSREKPYGSPFDDLQLGENGRVSNMGLADKSKLFSRVVGPETLHDEIVAKALGKPISPKLADAKAEEEFMALRLNRVADALKTEISGVLESGISLLNTDTVQTAIFTKMRRGL